MKEELIIAARRLIAEINPPNRASGVALVNVASLIKLRDALELIDAQDTRCIRELCISCTRVKMDGSAYFLATAPADQARYVGAKVVLCPECLAMRVK